MNVQRLSEEDRKAGKAFLRLVSAFVDIAKEGGHESPPGTMLKAFLYVCMEQGLSVREYAKRADVPYVTMSRHLLDLGDRNRKNQPGLGLVTARPNPLNRRAFEYMLTDKGQAFMERILRILDIKKNSLDDTLAKMSFFIVE
jgi:DNA-binding MarR family transcriptional regulator